MANTHSIDLEASSSQYLSLGSAASLRIKDNITLEGWFKFESVPGSGSLYWMIDKKSENGEDFSIYALFLHNVAGTQTLKFRTTNGSSASNNDQGVTWTPSVDTWYHVAVTRTNTGTIKFYINGTQQGTDQTGYNGTLHDNSDLGFYIGRYKSSDGRYFDGKIDDVRIWSVVRTQTEIDDNKTVEIDSDTGLVGSWHLNNALTDSSGNSNTLTNNNTATFSTDMAFTEAVASTFTPKLIII